MSAERAAAEMYCAAQPAEHDMAGGRGGLYPCRVRRYGGAGAGAGAGLGLVSSLCKLLLLHAACWTWMTNMLRIAALSAPLDVLLANSRGSVTAGARRRVAAGGGGGGGAMWSRFRRGKHSQVNPGALHSVKRSGNVNILFRANLRNAANEYPKSTQLLAVRPNADADCRRRVRSRLRRQAAWPGPVRGAFHCRSVHPLLHFFFRKTMQTHKPTSAKIGTPTTRPHHM